MKIIIIILLQIMEDNISSSSDYEPLHIRKEKIKENNKNNINDNITSDSDSDIDSNYDTSSDELVPLNIIKSNA